MTTVGEVLFETLINPEGEPVGPGPPITDEMVSAAHVPRFGDVLAELAELLRGKRIVAWDPVGAHG